MTESTILFLITGCLVLLWILHRRRRRRSPPIPWREHDHKYRPPYGKVSPIPEDQVW